MTCLVNPYRYASVTDPNFASVVLLVGADGTDASTSFVDESSFARTLTANGNAQIDTAQAKFGVSSILLDGTGDFVSAADSNDFAFGTGAFTVECFARFASAGATSSSFICQWGTALANCAIALFMSSGNLRLRFYNNVTLKDTFSAWAPAANTWYHVAADRDGSGTVRTYVDGVMQAKNTGFSQSMNNSANPMRIGSTQDFSLDHNGWIDEVRVTKGVARYASDSGFVVPTAAYPRS